MKSRRKSGKPMGFLVLIIFGGSVISLSGVLAVLGMPLGFTFMPGHIMIYPISGMIWYIGTIELLTGVGILLSAFFIDRGNYHNLQYWATIALIFSVVSLIGGGGLLIGALVAVIGSIFGLLYRPAAVVNRLGGDGLMKQRTKNATSHSMIAGLKEEEKKLYEIVNGSGGAIFQADLVEKSGFSKVKVSRILDRLEGRGILERRRRGMTNMVVLKSGDGAGSQ